MTGNFAVPLGRLILNLFTIYFHNSGESLPSSKKIHLPPVERYNTLTRTRSSMEVLRCPHDKRLTSNPTGCLIIGFMVGFRLISRWGQLTIVSRVQKFYLFHTICTRAAPRVTLFGRTGWQLRCRPRTVVDYVPDGDKPVSVSRSGALRSAQDRLRDHPYNWFGGLVLPYNSGFIKK